MLDVVPPVIDSGSVGDLWLVVKALSSETGLIGKAIVDGESRRIYSSLVDGDEASSILIGRWPAVSGGARVSSSDKSARRPLRFGGCRASGAGKL